MILSEGCTHERFLRTQNETVRLIFNASRRGEQIGGCGTFSSFEQFESQEEYIRSRRSPASARGQGKALDLFSAEARRGKSKIDIR